MVRRSAWVIQGLGAAAAALLFGSALQAQSVTIAPNYPSVPVDASVQLIATVIGLSSADVTWTVNGIVGGNATVGTITQAGLYTAPATVPAVTEVTAVSTVNPAVLGADYMNVETPGPTITSVTPNPLVIGNFTATIRGSGFQAGARVIETYGTAGQVEQQTTSVTTNTVIATGYQGPASSASFVVQNPGSAPSNAVFVPVVQGYTLKVKNGIGSGTYAAGTVVKILGNVPPVGEVFGGWIGAAVANSSASSTTLTMPAANTTVMATFSKSHHMLAVVNGTGSGRYAAGTVVTIRANAPLAGQIFQNWTGATVANTTSSTTTLSMPAANTTVTANYVATVATYTLTVVNGTGSGTYAAGTVVTITANAAPMGRTFHDWTGATVANTTSSTTTLTMPAANTTVTANYAATVATYTLTVVNGTGSGTYAAGTVITITANPAPAGQIFQSWTGATVARTTSSTTTLAMPAANTTVTANYVATVATYTLTVVSGTGSGTYTAGAVVTITANPAPAGQIFQSWTGATVAKATSSTTTLAMPAANTTVTANYVATVATYTLTVVNGSGSGTYAAGAVVSITANAPPAGESFIDWTGATVASANSASTSLTMPAASTTVTANYAAASQPSACGSMSTGVDASLNGFVPFQSTNAWNTDISSAPLDPNNDAITSAAGFAGLHLHHDFSSVAGGNYGIPYVVVGSSSTPLVPIDVVAYADQSDVAMAPFPITAPIEGSPADCTGGPNNYQGDAHVLVLDRKACFLYETFNTVRCNGAWSSDSETIWDMRSYDQRPWGWTSADAAGLPIFPGLVRYDEVAAGAINHAIRFTMQVTKNDANGGYFVEPATHAAGVYWGVSNVMGMRIRLQSSFDISGYSAANRVILTAMKKYGMILADNGGYFYFQGVPDTRWNDDDLLNLDAIQSSNFEVVEMAPTYPGYDAATAPTGQPPTIISFAASASTVAAGTPVTLTWETGNDSYDFIDKLGGVHGGSATATPTATTTYTLNATNQYGRSTAQVTVHVQ